MPQTGMQQLEPIQLARWLQAGTGDRAPLVLDVREAWETALCALPDSLVIPMYEIPSRLHEIAETRRPIVCLCHHGVRSLQVAMFLSHQGIPEVYNLAGGIDAWARQIDNSCPTY